VDFNTACLSLGEKTPLQYSAVQCMCVADVSGAFTCACMHVHVNYMSSCKSCALVDSCMLWTHAQNHRP
jgi:hypothetical protein